MITKKKLQKFIQPIGVFIIVQLAWLLLTALWIYYYISNHIIIEKVGNAVSPSLMPGSYHVLVLIFGCILLVLLQGGFYFIYIYLNRLINASKIHDQFISNITHELKSPLASIQLYLETLESRHVPEDKLYEFIQLMKKDASRLQDTISRILGTMMIDQKHLAFNFKVFNMKALIAAISKEVLVKYSDEIVKNISLVNQTSCRCVLDRNAFKIIFINLIDNAIKYMKDKFELLIQCQCLEKYFRIEFIDSGVGIQAKERKRVFRKFYRANNHKTPNVTGTGLGLYITKEIVRLHGGKIKVARPKQNMRTIIRIDLPIYKKTKKRYLKRLLKHTNRRKNRIEYAA